MKKLMMILILVLGTGISTVADIIASEEFNGNTLVIRNGNSYQPISIDLYYYAGSSWEYAGTYHISSGSSRSIDLGNDHYYNYGYKYNSNQVIAFYSSTVTLY